MKKSIQDRLRALRSKVRGNDLSQGGGLGNEVNYHIFDYDPEDEQVVMLEVGRLEESLSHIKVFNIYEIVISILNDEGYLESVMDIEKTAGAKVANQAISEIINSGSSGKAIVDRIVSSVKKGDIVCLTGVGQTHEFIRPHALLANLQNSINDIENPVILFYPGGYSGQSLSLFNIFPAENYYRAFKLVER